MNLVFKILFEHKLDILFEYKPDISFEYELDILLESALYIVHMCLSVCLSVIEFTI